MKELKRKPKIDKLMADEKFKKIMEPIQQEEAVIRLKNYRHHKNTTTYEHCLRVAIKSYRIAKILHIRINEKDLLRGAMLHDLYLYDVKEQQFSAYKHGTIHAEVALENAERLFDLSYLEKNIIYSHMWPLNLTHLPKCREAVLVSLADKICAVSEYCGRMPAVC